MKNICLVAALLCAVACQRAALPAATETVTAPVNQETKNEGGQTILIGKATVSAMQRQPYQAWFSESFNAYTADAAAITQLKPLLKDKTMQVFLGSWCGDSRREVPRMIKILQQAGIDTTRLSIVFVDNSSTRYKQSPQHEERGKNIHHVPTFIVYDGQHEMGRIIESPIASLEKDLLSILQQTPYQPNYKAIEYWNRQVPDHGAALSDATLRQLVPQLQPLCRHSGELNSYGYVLLAAGSTEEALNVFRLNTILYPSVPNLFDSLAEAYERTGKKAEAIAAYEKVLALSPGDERAKNRIAQLKKN